MPQYEYVCEADGEVVTLLRPMSEADAPVTDQAGRGRKFIRRHSTFAVAGAKPASSGAPRSHSGCGCGNPHGPCNR